jgi:hypothetical protein
MFWFLTPILLAVFFRLFWVIFGLFYGSQIVLIFGEKFSGAVTTAAVLSALVFTFGAYRYLHREYKKHIIGESH